MTVGIGVGGRWGRPALFLAALVLATVGSRDTLLRPLLPQLVDRETLGWISSAWSVPGLCILPLAYLTDRVHRRASRRRIHLLVAGLLMVAGWTSLLLVPANPGPLMVIGVSLGFASALAVVSVRGALVKIAQPLAATGRLAAALLGAQAVAALLEMPLLERLIERPLPWTAGAGASLGLVLALLAGVSLANRRAPASIPDQARPSASLSGYLRSRTFWVLLVVGTLAALAPPSYFLQIGRPPNTGPLPYELRLRGDLLASAAELIAAVVYALGCRRLAPRGLLPISLVAAALGWCAMAVGASGTSPAFEIGRTAQAFGDGLATVALTDLAFRAAPRGHEAFAFTLTAFAPIAVGSFFQTYLFLSGHGFSTGAFIAAAGILLGIVVARLLPRALVSAPDGRGSA